MNRHKHLGGVYIEMISNTLGVDKIVKGDHVRWELGKYLHQS